MSMLGIVVAAARVVVPVGVALKITSFVATGVQLHVAPPDVFDQFAPVAQVPPAPIREQFPDATPQFGVGNTRTAEMTQSVAFPSVQVIAVPGKGMSAPAPQKLLGAAAH